MAKIPGIYVEIKGDSTQLRKDMTAARQIVTESAKGMSDAMNNALSPDQIKRGANALINSLGNLSRGTATAGAAFDKLGFNLNGLQRVTGITDEQFNKLHARMLKTSASNTQEKALRDIAKAANLTEKEIRELGRQFGVSESQIKKISGSTKSAITSFNGLGGAAKAAMAYLSITQVYDFAKASFEATTQLDMWQRSMVAITGSQQLMRSEMAFLLEASRNTGQNFYNLTDSYRQLSAAARGTAISTEDVHNVFNAVSEAGAVLGLSAERVGLAFNALAQMASKGKVSMEELRQQLGDQIPGAMNIASRAMGVSVKEMFRMVEAGEVMASDLLPRLANELHKMYSEAANKSALESGQAAVNKLSQEWTSFKIAVSDSDVMISSINAVTGALKGMSDAINGQDTWDKGLALIKEGKLDRDAFIEAGWEKRKKLIDDATFHFVSAWQAAEQQNLNDYETFNLKRQEIDAEFESKGRQQLARYIETQQERLKREYDTVIQFASTDNERAMATARYNEQMELLNRKIEKQTILLSQAKNSTSQLLEWQAKGSDVNYGKDSWQLHRLFDLDQQKLEGVDNALNEFFGGIEDKGEKTFGELENAVATWASGFAGTLSDAVWGADASFSQIAESFGRMLTEMAVQKAVIEPILSGLLGSVGGGGGFIGAGLSLLGSFFEQGGVPGGKGISAYSNTIVDKPTLFPFARGIGLMGEAGSEAIMPLTRMPGGDLGVKAETGGGGEFNVFIENYSGVAATTTQTPNGTGGYDLRVVIDQEMARNIGRSGTATNKALLSATGGSAPLVRR